MKWVDCRVRPPDIRASQNEEGKRVFHRCRYQGQLMMVDPGQWIVEDDNKTLVLSPEAFAKRYITKPARDENTLCDTPTRKTTK